MEIKKMNYVGQATRLDLGERLHMFLNCFSNSINALGPSKRLSYSYFRNLLEAIFPLFITISNDELNILLAQQSGYAFSWHIKSKGAIFNILFQKK